MTLYSKILAPLDASARADRILAQAGPILLREDAEVILLQAMAVPVDSAVDYALLESDLAARVRSYLSLSTCSGRGVCVRWVTVAGGAEQAILEAAARERASLILISGYGRTGLPRWVLDSVSEKILCASPVPVLVLRSFPEREDGFHPRHILVPVDGSRTSLDVLPAVFHTARIFGARVTLLSVNESLAGTGFEGAASLATDELRKVAGQLAAQGLNPAKLVAWGDASSAILDVAQEKEADLIVLSTPGRSDPGRWALGSVTEKVLRGADRPVLVVKGTAGEKEAFCDSPPGPRADALPDHDDSLFLHCPEGGAGLLPSADHRGSGRQRAEPAHRGLHAAT